MLSCQFVCPLPLAFSLLLVGDIHVGYFAFNLIFFVLCCILFALCTLHSPFSTLQPIVIQSLNGMYEYHMHEHCLRLRPFAFFSSLVYPTEYLSIMLNTSKCQLRLHVPYTSCQGIRVYKKKRVQEDGIENSVRIFITLLVFLTNIYMPGMNAYALHSICTVANTVCHRTCTVWLPATMGSAKEPLHNMRSMSSVPTGLANNEPLFEGVFRQKMSGRTRERESNGKSHLLVGD